MPTSAEEAAPWVHKFLIEEAIGALERDEIEPNRLGIPKASGL
jgi:hypothetical protein